MDEWTSETSQTGNREHHRWFGGWAGTHKLVGSPVSQVNRGVSVQLRTKEVRRGGDYGTLFKYSGQITW